MQRIGHNELPYEFELPYFELLQSQICQSLRAFDLLPLRKASVHFNSLSLILLFFFWRIGSFHLYDIIKLILKVKVEDLCASLLSIIMQLSSHP